jgi:SET domain
MLKRYPLAVSDKSKAMHSSDLPCHAKNALIATDSTSFYVGCGSKGRGLFAATDLEPGTVIHVAPCINVSKGEYEQHMRHTILEHYLFNDVRSGNKLLALGYGSLFNHSNHPNVSYKVNSASQTIEYRSGYSTIPIGTELCISYGSSLWFKDADAQSRSIDSTDTEEECPSGVVGFLKRMQIDGCDNTTSS